MKNQIKLLYLLPSLILIQLITSCNKVQKNEKTENIITTEHKNSKIDSLNKESEVEYFIRKIDSNYNEFELKKIKDFDRNQGDFNSDSITKIIAKKLNITESFYKCDFDNNGFTDLLVIGDNKDCISTKPCSFNSMVLMNFANDSINIVDIIRVRRSSFVPIIEKENNKTFLVIKNPEQINWKNEIYKDAWTEKLVYKFGDFIEFNPSPTTNKIESIEFSTSPCYGNCPIFTISINDNRESKFLAEHYNFDKNFDFTNEDKEGTFKTIITKDKYSEIINLIYYLDFENLNDNYWVNWTDDQTSILKITYENGKTKIIKDYGLIGTYGLKRLYELLFDLRFNQKWQEI